MKHLNRNQRPRRTARRGFNLVELLVALTITATLLAATMVALDASFKAYQSTTEQASTHTISRLAMHRILTMIRTGTDFTPKPGDPLDIIIESEFIDFQIPTDTGTEIITIEWDDMDEILYVRVGGAGEPRYPILEGVIEQIFPVGHPREGERIPPFTLEYDRGFRLFRATINLAVRPDDNMTVNLDGDHEEIIRLVATSMPRNNGAHN